MDTHITSYHHTMLTVVAACSTNMLSDSCLEPSLRSWCLWLKHSASCLSLLLGKASSVQIYTAPVHMIGQHVFSGSINTFAVWKRAGLKT